MYYIFNGIKIETMDDVYAYVAAHDGKYPTCSGTSNPALGPDGIQHAGYFDLKGEFHNRHTNMQEAMQFDPYSVDPTTFTPSGSMAQKDALAMRGGEFVTFNVIREAPIFIYSTPGNSAKAV